MPGKYFECRNGKMLLDDFYQKWKCDGDNDCGDNSEEQTCGKWMGNLTFVNSQESLMKPLIFLSFLNLFLMLRVRGYVFLVCKLFFFVQLKSVRSWTMYQNMWFLRRR